VTDTNTKPSEAIQRYETDVRGEDRDPYPLDTDDEGRFVLHCDHLAALARAREEARREALQDAKFAAEATGRVVTDGLARLGRYEQGYARARADIEYAIHSLLTPTPQGESRVDQKRPPPPEDLVDALQDRVHPASGPLIQSKPVTPQGETKEND
jgi:hypothetical protein